MPRRSSTRTTCASSAASSCDLVYVSPDLRRDALPRGLRVRGIPGHRARPRHQEPRLPRPALRRRAGGADGAPPDGGARRAISMSAAARASSSRPRATAGGARSASTSTRPRSSSGAARGLDLRTVALEDAGFAPASFDAVSLFDVLEHLLDPIGRCAPARGCSHRAASCFSTCRTTTRRRGC